MKLSYTNTSKEYDELLKFNLLTTEKRKYIFLYIFAPMLMLFIYFWSRYLLTTNELIKLFSYMIIPSILGIFAPKLFLLINRKMFNWIANAYNLSDKKEVLIEEDKEEIKYNQFSKMPPCNFKFKDITKIIQNDDNIFIFRRDEKLPNFTLIIPNYVFENEEARIEFINMLSKVNSDKKKQK
ncbi:hypothetical protein [uncultured Clostridium sp.]|uniref:hypothetical protein n=1 Tax=uncultured Clostridium sp. TaxID=59620 RepID=UPI00263B8F66|nr:hypothetical protein [uncultured Clostridium sp.]